MRHNLIALNICFNINFCICIGVCINCHLPNQSSYLSVPYLQCSQRELDNLGFGLEKSFVSNIYLRVRYVGT